MKKFLLAVAVMVGICLLSATPVLAALDFDFSGNFNQDNDIVLLNFTVGEVSTITIFSSSWDDGGFDPILAIWDASGDLVNQQDDGHNVGSTLSNAVSYDHGNWDSYYDVILAVGDYTASIGQFDNFAAGGNLSDGFTHDGDPHFTQAFGPQPDFNGVLSSTDGRTSDWTFHILNVEEASNPGEIPEPASFLIWALIGLSCAGVAQWRRRRA